MYYRIIKDTTTTQPEYLKDVRFYHMINLLYWPNLNLCLQSLTPIHLFNSLEYGH
jgi:hypothetical protein